MSRINIRSLQNSSIGRRTSTESRPDSNERGSRSPYEPGIERSSLMTRLTDLSLAAVILIIPFVMGGRTPMGELLLVGLVLIAATCWSLSQIASSRPQVRWSLAELLFLAGLALGVLQLIPFDQRTLHEISPCLSEILPLRTSMDPAESGSFTTSLPHWTQLSLYPAVTRQGLILLGAYALLFSVTLQRIQQGKEVERLLGLVASASVLMAFFGLVQYFFGNGKFFWVFEHPQTSTSDFVKGAFSNRNHFAHFLALGAGPLLWLLLKYFDPSGSPSRVPTNRSVFLPFIMAVGLGSVMFAALLSLSRGGAVALFGAVSVTMLFSLRAGILNARMVLALVVSAIFLGTGLFFYGQDKVGEKLDELLSGDLSKLDHSDGRLDLWKTVLAAGLKFPVVGAGIGAHRELYPAFQHLPAQHDFTHAENGYLQIFEETGAVGLGTMLVGILCCLIWTLRGSNHRHSGFAGCSAAIAGSLAANVIHSFGDFVWYAPGIMAVVVILSAAACRLAQISRNVPALSGFSARVACSAVLLLSLAGGAWSVPQLVARVKAEPHWINYQKLALVRPGESEFNSDGNERNPVPQIQALRKLLKENSEDARAHARLARLYLIQFHLVQQKSENRMDVEQIRDAVVNSNFPSADQMNAWMDTAFGRPRKLLDLALHHCRESLKHSPLLGDNYLFYAQLRFLEHPQPEDLSPLWKQAVLLRPMDGLVLFNVGHEYALRLEEETACEFWQRAFKTGPAQQRKIIDALASHFGAATFIEKFNPDVNSAFQLAKFYKHQNRDQDYRIALVHYAKASETFAKKTRDSQSARAWLGAFNVYRELGDEHQADRCLNSALEQDSFDFEVRLAAGQWFLLHQKYPEAEEHFTWCSQRRPDDRQLRSMVQQISHKALDNKLVDPLPSEIHTDGPAEIDSTFSPGSRPSE